MSGSFTTRLGDAPEEGIKAPCVVATTADITLSGEQTIGSVVVVAGNRVLVRAQTDKTENGIYNVAATAWTRAVDWNNANDVISGVLALDASNGGIFQAKFTGSYDPGVTSLEFLAQPLGFATIAESITLTDGQLAVSLVNTTITYSSFYISGLLTDNGRLVLTTDYTYDSGTDIVTLVESYPAGSILTAVANQS